MQVAPPLNEHTAKKFCPAELHSMIDTEQYRSAELAANFEAYAAAKIGVESALFPLVIGIQKCFTGSLKLYCHKG